MERMKKGEFCTYVKRGVGTIRAIVRRAHRDGSYTVEARHVLRNGEPYGCYLGYKYRMEAGDLTPEPA